MDPRETLRVPVLCDWRYYCGILSGVVYGHDRFQDGQRIETSMVESMCLEGGYALTESGSQYRLDWACVHYLRGALESGMWPPRVALQAKGVA